MKYNPWDPEVWGPIAWRILHSIAVVVSGAQMKQIMQAFAHAVPCSSCHRHILEMLERHRSRRDASRYMFDIHNEVNARLHKPVLGAVPRYLPPQAVPSFCSEFRRLVDIMRTKRDEEEIRPFVDAVARALAPFSCI